MKTLKATLLSGALGCFLIVTTVGAQTTWNYVISSAGGADSLDSIVAWSVTGDLATPPGQVLPLNISSLAISVVAPGIYASSYSDNNNMLPIPDPDGSAFQYYPNNLSAPIVQYSVNTAAGNGNQSFGLVAPLLPNSVGQSLLYSPGTQSLELRLPFFDLNPGTYSSVENIFSTPITVNLTIEPVPEPSSWALAAGMGLSAVLMARKTKRQTSEKLPLL